MPKAAAKSNKKRLNLILETDVCERIEVLKTETGGSSITDVIRRSLAVYEYLLSQKKKGARLLIEDKNSSRELVLM